MKKKVQFTTLWLTYAGVLVALQIVLGNLTQVALLTKQMNFGFLPIAVAGYLLGPVGAVSVAVLGDVLGAHLFPAGVYYFGFTITQALVGLTYGLVMSPENLTWMDRSLRKPGLAITARAALASTIAAVILTFLNPIWLVVITHKGYWLLLSGRVIFNLVEIPIFTTLITLTCISLNRIPLSNLPAPLLVAKLSPSTDSHVPLNNNAINKADDKGEKTASIKSKENP